MHLLNSLVGLTLVYMTYQLPFGLFVMRNAFSSVPSVISEAAEIDGASPLRSLWHVQLPLVVPGILTVSIFAFIAAWNDFIAALILLSSQSNFTLPVELLDLVTGQFGVIQWGVLEAGVLISMVPCVVLFLVLQRYYMGGLLSGAVK
jgi:multiple sugar transport system permease protein